MLIIYETVIAYRLHKQITTSFQHRLHKKNYHSWIFENFIKVSPKPNYTYLFYFQTNINNIRSSYIFCVDFPHKLGLQIAGACKMYMKRKNENGELFDFLPSVRNSFHAFWINDLLASVNGSTFFLSTLSYLFILLILARENICIIQCCE